jgi:hypothetical protein
MSKICNRKYGYLAKNEAETDSWERLCVDLIGQYTVKTSKGNEPLEIWCITMIDQATGWFEMKELIKKKQSQHQIQSNKHGLLDTQHLKFCCMTEVQISWLCLPK